MELNGGNMSSGIFRGTLMTQSGNVSNIGMRSIRNKKSSRYQKSLNYNPREIPSQLVRAKKSGNASVVLIRAKSKLGVLQRALASGQYNESEVRIAIAHARKMVQCSRLKVKNLREEEELGQQNDRERETAKQKKKNEMKRRINRKEQEIKAKIAAEENRQALAEKSMRLELQRKRRMHRSEEQGKISEANMKYLEEQLRNSQSSAQQEMTGVVLEFSGTALQMADMEASCPMPADAPAEVSAPVSVDVMV